MSAEAVGNRTASTSGREFNDDQLQEQLARISQILPSDLHHVCLNHVVLLHAIDTWPNGGMYEGNFLKEAIKRYLELWLPLLSRLPAFERGHTLPPLDVAYVWHIHRLLAQEYDQYCQYNLHKSIHPQHHQAFGFASDAPECWQNEHPDDPFYPPVPRVQYSRPYDAYAQFLQAEVLCQASYGRMLLRSCYQDVNFLTQARLRYCRFLLLMKLHPEVRLVPTPDIDLMWRTHISLSAEYQQDCISILGRVPEHDLMFDVSSNLSESPAFLHTKRLYESHFPTEGYELSPLNYIPRETRPHVVDLLSKADRMFGSHKVPRVGGHMLYVHWALLEEIRQEERQEKRRRKGLKSALLSPRGKGDVRSSALETWREKMDGMVRFKNLPHSSDHKYWRWFRQGPMAGGIVKTQGGVDGSLACVGWASDDLESAMPDNGRFPEEAPACEVCGEPNLQRTDSGRSRRASWPMQGVFRVEARRWGRGYGLVKTMAVEGGVEEVENFRSTQPDGELDGQEGGAATTWTSDTSGEEEGRDTQRLYSANSKEEDVRRDSMGSPVSCPRFRRSGAVKMEVGEKFGW